MVELLGAVTELLGAAGAIQACTEFTIAIYPGIRELLLPTGPPSPGLRHPLPCARPRLGVMPLEFNPHLIAGIPPAFTLCRYGPFRPCFLLFMRTATLIASDLNKHIALGPFKAFVEVESYFIAQADLFRRAYWVLWNALFSEAVGTGGFAGLGGVL